MKINSRNRNCKRTFNLFESYLHSFIKIFDSLDKNAIKIIDLNSFHFNGMDYMIKLCKWLNTILNQA